ncbi:MAG: HNH endonuclease, partial [Actinomycetota bacterium]|nr:HNH endonuclease [Actinomycetota bacterium]
MFENAGSRSTTTSEVVGWSAALRSLTITAPVGDGAGLIDQISALEALKSAASAAQARATVRFAAAQRAAQREAGLPSAAIGRGIAAQVALARRDSPAKGSRHLGLAEALVYELPNTMT